MTRTVAVPGRSCRKPGYAVAVAIGAILFSPQGAFGRDAGDPIKLIWNEGDVAGMERILSPDGTTTIGFVEYHQRLRGDVLHTVRVSRFVDGSSDEDEADARLGDTLDALGGRSIIRDAHGNPIVDLSIDVTAGHVSGFTGHGKDRKTFDDDVDLPRGTYWGALIFIVLKNFDANAADNRLVFHTIVPTPKPRSIDLELVRHGEATLQQPGNRLDVQRFTLQPTIHWLLDPIIQRIAPTTEFFVRAGAPPALARFEGPRNYSGEEMLLE